MRTSSAREVDGKFWSALGKPWRIAYFGDVVLDLSNLSVEIWCLIFFGYISSFFSDLNIIMRDFVPFRSSKKLSAPKEGNVLTGA